MLFTSLFVACGGPDSASDTSSSEPGAPSPEQNGASALAPEANARLMTLRSDKRSIEARSLDVNIKLGWGLEVGAAIGSTVQMMTESEVILQKSYHGSGSRILADDSGTLDVRDDEPIIGICRYTATTQLRINRGSTLSLGGVRVEGSSDFLRGIEVGIDGQVFDAKRGWTLADVESLCFEQFSREVSGSIAHQVDAGVRAQVQIVRHGDDRIEGVRFLASGQEAKMTHRGYRFYAEPFQIEEQGNEILVAGTLTRERFLAFDENFTFDLRFDRQSLQLTRMQMQPRGLTPKDRAAVSLAAFLARNIAGLSRREAAREPFVIDTALLEAF